MDYGLNTLNKTGRSIMLIADGNFQWAKPGGISLDLNVIAAPGAPVTLLDDTVIPTGLKYLRYGQVVCKIVSTANGGTVGYYGPYDPAATDGRATLIRGECYLLNRTWMDNPGGALTNLQTTHPPVIEGGLVWKPRLLVTTGAHSLAAGPTWAEFEAAFPNIRYVEQNASPVS